MVSRDSNYKLQLSTTPLGESDGADGFRPATLPQEPLDYAYPHRSSGHRLVTGPSHDQESHGLLPSVWKRYEKAVVALHEELKWEIGDLQRAICRDSGTTFTMRRMSFGAGGIPVTRR